MCDANGEIVTKLSRIMRIPLGLTKHRVDFLTLLFTDFFRREYTAREITPNLKKRK